MATVYDVSRLIRGTIGQSLIVYGPRLREPYLTQFYQYKRKLKTLRGLLKAKYGRNALVTKNFQDPLEPEPEALFVGCARMQNALISPMNEEVSSV